jgi:hypothetical protein
MVIEEDCLVTCDGAMEKIARLRCGDWLECNLTRRWHALCCSPCTMRTTLRFNVILIVCVMRVAPGADPRRR